jgi:hypothetical protein
MNQQNKGIKSNISSSMDDIFERILSTRLEGQEDVDWDFIAFRSVSSNSYPS